MVIVATAVFERNIHHAHCTDRSNPGAPRLVVDALIRDGDLDGPLLLPVPVYRVFAGKSADACLARLRDAGRIEYVDGVANLRFTTWTFEAEE